MAGLVAAPENLAEGMHDHCSLARTDGGHVLLQQHRELKQEPMYLSTCRHWVSVAAFSRWRLACMQR